MHTFISGQKGDTKVTCSAAYLFFTLNSIQKYGGKLMTCIYRENFSFSENSLYCVRVKGFPSGLYYRESIELSSHGF